MAQQFTDAEGRVWDVHIDIPTAQRVRRMTELNILDADGKQGIINTVDDPLALAEILYATLKPQADKLTVLAADFYKAFHGDVITEARTAFWEALTDFFPASRREELLELQQTAERVREAMTGSLTAKTLDLPPKPTTPGTP